MRMKGLKCPRCGSANVTAHMEPVDATGEAELWVPVRDEGFRCADCELLETCLTSAGQSYLDFNQRWNRVQEPFDEAAHRAYLRERDREEEADAKAWTWPHDDGDVHDRAWRAEELGRHLEGPFDHTTIVEHALKFSDVPALPTNPALLTRIVENPDSVDARRRLVQWLGSVNHPMASLASQFIDGQLRLAAAFANDPRSEIKDSLPPSVFSPRDQGTNTVPDIAWWRLPDGELASAMYDFTFVLRELELVADQDYYRGFVEHVAIKASRFLEIADELYSLAPIRQLTITYCKGVNHDDLGLFRELLASPHLKRIRGLKLPLRKFGQDKGELTKLNVLTDDDIAMLAASENLRGLRYLNLEDQGKLTVRAFDALAASKNLPELSAVMHDINRYWYPGTFSFGRVGAQKRELHRRPLHDYKQQLEARHGRLPWLHVAENYGSETPDVEAVIEHPVAMR